MEQDSHPESVSPPTRNSVEPKKATDVRRVLACGTCRKRKLKCDSQRPKCSTCARLGHPCHYDEVRKKSGPKRGYVKELEARLRQVETLLTTQQGSEGSMDTSEPPQDQGMFSSAPVPGFTVDTFGTSTTINQPDNNLIDPNLNMIPGFEENGGIEDFNWDMIALGLEEPLPSQEVMDELYQIYFEKVHPSLPMIHRPRFMASLNMATSLRPPVCLRYMMWALACALTPQYKSSAQHFYEKGRKYIEQDEMKGQGENFISISHAQTFVLISTYEFKSMHFPRAWMSCGKSVRICQLMGLHRQDRLGLDVKQTMPPPKDWIDREERRRTFWLAYCNDRYASIGTGWPLAIDERDILTNLPASDEAYISGKSEPTPSLADVLAGDGVSSLSSLAGVCLLATLFGRNLTHLHRPADDDNDHDLNGEFWKRHRSLDNILLNTSLSLPSHLRLPYGLKDTNIVFANMNIHTSTICLHQAAIFKADKHRLPPQISAESKRRCIVAADQITNIMKMCSHLDLSTLHPFIAFCLYVAARVFVQYLKSRREDQTVMASLTFLLSAMQALKFKNPLTESFLVQIDVDLESSGLNIPSPFGSNRYAARVAAECPANTDAVKCLPIFEIRESQTLGQAAREINLGQIDPNAAANVDFSGLNYDAMTHQRAVAAQKKLNPGGFAINNTSPTTFAPEGLQNHSDPSYDYFGQKASPQMPGDGNSNSSYSNQPTPAMSTSSNNRSSNTSHTPPSLHEHVNGGFMSDKQRVLPQRSPLPNGPFAQNGFQSDTKMTNENAQNQQGSSGFGNIFGGTGFTPGPTGPTGLTPGPTGMTPMASWNDMNGAENNEWMFTDWSVSNEGQTTSRTS